MRTTLAPPRASRFSTRDSAQGAIIQAYAKSKYDSHVVVNDLLQFSLDVAVGVGALKQYPPRDWHQFLKEEKHWLEGKTKGWLGRLLHTRKKPFSLWNRLGLGLHALCAVATLLATRPCKAKLGWGVEGGRSGAD